MKRDKENTRFIRKTTDLEKNANIEHCLDTGFVEKRVRRNDCSYIYLSIRTLASIIRINVSVFTRSRTNLTSASDPI